MTNFSSAFSPSFKANTFTTTAIPGIDYKSASKFNLSNINFKKANSLTFNPIAFDPSLNLLDAGWSFITAPENVSWDVANQATRIDIFGTNSPPVVAGSRGMRDLSLGNSLVEGFVRGVTVGAKIAALENLMNYKLNQTDGFVSVPVYQVTANDRVYGNGFFIIKDIKVNEKMRDTKGDTTRAYVDISLMEVPEYQVNSGRDQASKVAASAKSILPTGVTGANKGNLGVGQSGSPAGPTAPTSASPPKTPPAKGSGFKSGGNPNLTLTAPLALTPR